MANIKSKKKDLRRIAKRRVRNKAVRSALKTHAKNVRVAAAENVEDVDAKLQIAIKNIDKAKENRVIHPNTAARKKSRLMKLAHKAKTAQSTS
jgi:small subunit ribosomal protein S20